MAAENSPNATTQHREAGPVRREPAMSHSPNLVLLAVGWGPKLGGINAFNTDFAKALGETLGPNRVVCVALSADDGEIADAAASNVTLLPLGKNKEEFDDYYAEAVLGLLGKKSIPFDSSTVWIGHDVHTGPVALRLAEITSQGRSVVIQHMSYGDYIGVRDGKGEKGHEKQQTQEALYRKADVVFAVGPLLCERLSRTVHDQGKTAHMIVPGLAEITPNDAPHEDFRAIAMGRLGPGDDLIKQGRLALVAFASAIGKAHEEGWPENLKNGEMFLYGIDEAGGKEEEELRELAEEEAGRAIKLTPLKFTHDRARLFKDLASCDVALMLSWHEGFGLTGWEAIAAGVPLIASRNSGLYKLLQKDEDLADAALGLLEHLDVRGSSTSVTDKNYRPEDKSDVRSALLKLARDTKKARKNALRLRQMLIDKGFTWPGAAVKFLNNLATSKPAVPKPEWGEIPTTVRIGVSAGPQNSAQSMNSASVETMPEPPHLSEEEKERSRKLAAQLTQHFEFDELRTITDTFIERHKETNPDLELTRRNLASYLLSEENENRRYNNVAEFVVIAIDRKVCLTELLKFHDLFGYLLQTLIRRCHDTEDRGFTRLPFERPQSVELMVATRIVASHVPNFSTKDQEFKLGQRDKHWKNIGTYTPSSGIWDPEENCQEIAAMLLMEWFGYSIEELPSDRLDGLRGRLKFVDSLKPKDKPIHSLYVSNAGPSNLLNIHDIAARLHETLGNLLWIYQYEKKPWPDASKWLYTPESDVEGLIRGYEKSILTTLQQPETSSKELEGNMEQKGINVGNIGNGSVVSIVAGHQSNSAVGKGNIVLSVTQDKQLQSLLDKLKHDAGQSLAVDKPIYAEITQVSQQLSQEFSKPEGASKTVLQSSIDILGKFGDVADIAESINKVTTFLLTLIG